MKSIQFCVCDLKLHIRKFKKLIAYHVVVRNYVN